MSFGTSGWVLIVSTVLRTEVGVSLKPSNHWSRSMPHLRMVGGINAGILIWAIMLSGIAVAQSSKKAGKAQTLEVSFDYQHQAGPGSNQYAVWIENEKGEL